MGKWGLGDKADGRLYAPLDKTGHQNALRVMLKATTGPVLELGCGPNSTGWLHDNTGNRRLLSMDHHEKWLRQFADGTYKDGKGNPMFAGPLEDARHEFICVHEWTDAEDILKRNWSVALVDAAPASSRAWLVTQLAWSCRFIVIHDTETYSYQLGSVLCGFNWQVTDRSALPFTTVVSNLQRIPGFRITATAGKP